MIEKITQSFIKDAREYYNGDGCGNLMKAKWVDDRLFEPEEPGAMNLGAYFEFIAFGTLPKNGKVPMPVYMASKVKANGGKTVGLQVSDMYDDYRRVHVNAERVKDYLNRMGLKVISAGKKITKGRFEGTLDLVVECQKELEFNKDTWNYIIWKVGDQFVFDLKYSGLLGRGDRYNKHGWDWSTVQKEYHGTQAIQYHHISGLPFYFLVCSSTNEIDIKLFYIPAREEMIEKQITQANALFDRFVMEEKTIGFEVRPELVKCAKCPLFAECEDRALFPTVEVINISTE